jgi:hypothetical protein
MESAARGLREGVSNRSLRRYLDLAIDAIYRTRPSLSLGTTMLIKKRARLSTCGNRLPKPNFVPGSKPALGRPNSLRGPPLYAVIQTQMSL